MFNNAAKLAQEAKDMAAEVRTDHRNHVAVCLDNQRRIETRFTNVEAKLDRQDTEFERFNRDMTVRLDAIKDNDNKRYYAMMTLIVTTVIGIAVQIVFHFIGIKM